jgi:D-sedoheptulose 7-phosphate isomerase
LIEEIKAYYRKEINTINSLNWSEIEQAVNAIIDAYYREATIYIFGNGGSAATASHFANDFNKGISEQLEKKFKVVCLCDNLATVMAIANDISYDEVFRFQLEGRLKNNDLVIGISASGNSTNIINGIMYAREIGCPTIGITGYTGGRVKEITDYHMHCTIDDIQIAEDIHMTFDHMMYHIIIDALKKTKR